MSRWLTTIICLVALSVLFIGQSVVVRAAEATGAITSGLIEARNEAFPDQKNQTAVPLPKLIGQIIGYALSFVGVVFFVLSVYGGFLWMTARGNSERTEKGKETIIAAAIGVIIIVGSYALTRFVLGSADSTSSTIPQQNKSCGYTTGGCDAGEKCSVNNVCISEGICLADGDCLNGMVCSDRLCTSNFSNPSSDQTMQCVSKVCPRGTSGSGLDCSWSNGVRIITFPVSGRTCEDLNVTECQNYINYCDLNNTSVLQQ